MAQVSEEVSEGVLLWNASIVLKTYLEDKARSEFLGAHVLELGAGAGHLSLALSRMGAHVTSTEAKCSHAAKGKILNYYYTVRINYTRVTAQYA